MELSIEAFKTKHIENIVKNYPERKFIIIFDNSNLSLLIAEELNAKCSRIVAPIYLREIIFNQKASLRQVSLQPST